MQNDFQLTENQLISGLNWRYATKKFDSQRKVPEEIVKTLFESFRLTPSSFGLQPWSLIRVSDDETKKKLLPFSWGQAQVVDCSDHLILCRYQEMKDQYVHDFVEQTKKERVQTDEQVGGYRNIMLGFLKNMDTTGKERWMEKQTYIALGNLMTCCAFLGIDACPMEGISQKDYDKVLGLEEKNLTTVVACPIGYRHTDDKYADLPKIRRPLSDFYK